MIKKLSIYGDRKCSHNNCNNIYLHNIHNNNSFSINNYCYKHYKYDIHLEINKLENIFFENKYLNNEHNLILCLKNILYSFHKFQYLKKIVKKLIIKYKSLCNEINYDLYVKKYILYTEYYNFLNSIINVKKNIFSVGLKIPNFIFNENIKFIFNKKFFLHKFKKSFFYNYIDLNSDMMKIKNNINLLLFNNFKKQNNFYHLFSDDIENIIYDYFINIFTNDNIFYNNLSLKIKLNVDFKNNIIMYNNKNNFKFLIIK